MDRIAPTRSPADKVIGYQRWHWLSFLHWRLPAEQIAPLIPVPLTLDTWEGDAWVALVPFAMTGVRPWWSPPVPGVSNFLETNVRTYVHVDGDNPGVYFFSLEAAQSLAVRIARWNWNLPYHRATMSLRQEGMRIRYETRRRWPGTSGAGGVVEVEVGEPLPGEQPGLATPGSLEHFLAERYLLYTLNSRNVLLRGQVHHSPYPLHQARLLQLEDTLLSDAGITVSGPPDHLLYSPGVTVNIHPLKPCPRTATLTPQV